MQRRAVLAPEFEKAGLELVPRVFQYDDVQGVLIDGLSPADDLPAHTSSLLTELNSEPRKILYVLASSEQAELATYEFNLTPTVKAFAQQIRFSHRAEEMEREADLRRETIRSFCASEPLKYTETRPDAGYVLFVGGPSSFYLRCRQWLADSGIDLKAALSERTAFDAMNTQQPLAVLLQSAQDDFPHELVDHIQGRADLTGMPVVAITGFMQIVPEAIDGLSGIIRMGSNEQTTRKAVLAHIQSSQRVVPYSARRFAPPVRDRYSSAFSDAFAKAHILAQTVHARASGEPLSVAVLFPFNQKTGGVIKSSELTVFSNLLEAVVRCQDMVARLDWSRFVVSLPGSAISDAEQALNRIRNIFEATPSQQKSEGAFSFSFQVFEVGNTRTPEKIWMMIDQSEWKNNKLVQSSVA